MKTIAIIGGGPGGLMAAEVVASAGHRVTVYERKPTPARKLLMAGNGGLNITHSEPLEDFIARYGAAADWIGPCVRAFTPDDLRNWCAALGQETFVGSSGRVFPTTMKASPLLRAWVERLTQKGVEIIRNAEWQGFDDSGALIINGAAVKADAVLFSLGGASWPRLGSDGSWQQYLSARGVKIAPFEPSNCGFVINWSDLFKQKFAGQPLKPVVLKVGAREVQGEVMITAQGIEGGAVYALSSLLREEIKQHGHTTLTLDLKPGVSEEALRQKLEAPRGSQSLSTYLKRTLHLSPMAISLLHEVKAATSDDLAHQIKNLPLVTTATTGIARAISSAGGIKRSSVDENFMLRALPGHFVAGEMLDWEAPTGGYLLQATFSTARQAALGLLGWVDKR